MIMAEKKDPGKFTVRFNIADPQQRTVIELLNQQGRYKAQFLTNAVLHYVQRSEIPDVRGVPAASTEYIERIVRSVLAQQQAASSQKVPSLWESMESRPPQQDIESEDADRETIFKTLEAFQQQ